MVTRVNVANRMFQHPSVNSKATKVLERENGGGRKLSASRLPEFGIRKYGLNIF